VTIRFEKPAGATGAYEFTASAQLWKVTIPKGEWRDVVLSTDPGDASSNLVVLSNDPSVSPRSPARRTVDVWRTMYGIFGQNRGTTMLEVQDQTSGNVITFIQVFVDDSIKASASGGSITLRYKSQKPTVNGGDYDWPTEFVLRNADGSTNGFIVQKVYIGFESADPTVKSEHDHWWEAWRVMNGRVFSGLSKTQLSAGDTANSANTGGLRGTQWHRFEAKFMPNYAEPEKWGKISNRAGPLPATRAQPPGWITLGTTRRSITVDFDGTKTPPTSTVTFLMENF
jgi:hypothetical protein